MDLRKIKKLIEIVEECDLAELEVHKGDESVRIVRRVGAALSDPLTASAAPPPSGKPPPAAATAKATIRAPMAGTFYGAPEPGAEPYAKVGSRIATGDILCIIESMKMMNEIPSDADGSILEVLVADREPVAKGQALFRLG